MGMAYTKPLSVTNSLQHVLPREELPVVFFFKEVVYEEVFLYPFIPKHVVVCTIVAGESRFIATHSVLVRDL